MFSGNALANLAINVPMAERAMQRLRAWRRQPVFGEAGIVYIHIPRTAGTSIAGELFNRFIGHFTLADMLAVSRAEVVALPRFTIVRNPWDRLVSAWKFAREGRGQGGDITVTVDPRVQREVLSYRTFDRFVEEWLVADDVANRDGIFRQQTDYIIDRHGSVLFDHVGRMDAMAATEAWLQDTLRRPVRFSHSNRTRPSDYRSYYTPRTRDLVAALYARDVAALGYDF